MNHRSVADVAVIGLPDEEWGQIVAAAVQLTPRKDSRHLGPVAALPARSPGSKSSDSS